MSEDKKSKPAETRPSLISLLVQWFVGIKGEFKRVTWPSKPEVIKMTVIVITTCAIFGVVIVGMDAAIAAGYNFVFGLLA